MQFDIENRRYTGSKAKLIDWIFNIIKNECSGKTFFDVFAGTGIVAKNATNYYKKVILNDLLYSNNVIYKAFFGGEPYSKEKLIDIKNEFNKIEENQLKENYFSINFGNKYFQNDIAKKIWEIRQLIEKKYQIEKNITEKEYNILLASLIYSADKISNTVGHYDAYFKNTKDYKKLKFNIINPIKYSNVNIYREDANILVDEIKSDIAYIDPPYNSRQYSRFYHVLETLIKNEERELFGVAMKPQPENMSEYCKSKAPNFFEELISKLNSKYIVVSYNNTYNSKSNSSKNKIELEFINEILSRKGKTKIFETSHKHFNAGNTNFDNHKEILFVTKVKGIKK